MDLSQYLWDQLDLSLWDLWDLSQYLWHQWDLCFLILCIQWDLSQYCWHRLVRYFLIRWDLWGLSQYLWHQWDLCFLRQYVQWDRLDPSPQLIPQTPDYHFPLLVQSIPLRLLDQWHLSSRRNHHL